jgi:CubicO group peptidase (beta-lactamase class C family)
MWCPEGGASAIIDWDGASQISVNTVGSDHSFRWASVTKLVTALACCVATEEGSVGADDAIAGFDDVTLAHLLSHAGGIDWDTPTQKYPAETRRLYSNASIQIAAAHVERSTGMAFEEYVRSGVLQPLQMSGVIWGDPAAGASGTIRDLAAFATELLAPILISAPTLHEATRPWFPTLDGIVPGFGTQRPCPWGLGFEIRGTKQHWMGRTTSPETFGHFGQSGAMLAVDPIRKRAWCSLSPTPFGPWAAEQWPVFIDASPFRH